MFTWLLAVNEDQHHKGDMGGSEFANGAEGVRALWSWTIRSHSSSSSAAAPSSSSSSTGHGKDQGPDEVKGKLTSRFEVLKDEVQSVFPIIKVRRGIINDHLGVGKLNEKHQQTAAGTCSSKHAHTHTHMTRSFVFLFFFYSFWSASAYLYHISFSFFVPNYLTDSAQSEIRELGITNH